jgi:hypothetical protein
LLTVFTLKLMGQFLTTSPVQVVAVVWRIMLGRMLGRSVARGSKHTHTVYTHTVHTRPVHTLFFSFSLVLQFVTMHSVDTQTVHMHTMHRQTVHTHTITHFSLLTSHLCHFSLVSISHSFPFLTRFHFSLVSISRSFLFLIVYVYAHTSFPVSHLRLVSRLFLVSHKVFSFSLCFSVSR